MTMILVFLPLLKNEQRVYKPQKTVFMKRIFSLIALLLVVSFVANDTIAQTRKEKKASKKATAKSRGTKLVREECEELAMDITSPNPRAAGNAQSMNEAFATNMALLDARAKLAQQLAVMVDGMAKSFSQQHVTNDKASFEQKSSNIQRAYFEKFLTNTRAICKNTYLTEDGNYNVYVCIEMDPNLSKTVYEQLKKDQIISIEYSEEKFMQEMKEARKVYIENLENIE